MILSNRMEYQLLRYTNLLHLAWPPLIQYYNFRSTKAKNKICMQHAAYSTKRVSLLFLVSLITLCFISQHHRYKGTDQQSWARDNTAYCIIYMFVVHGNSIQTPITKHFHIFLVSEAPLRCLVVEKLHTCRVPSSAYQIINCCIQDANHTVHIFGSEFFS